MDRETGRRLSLGKQRALPQEEQTGPSRVAERGTDERRRNEAFAPALCRTQGSAITRVLAAGRSGRSALALPPGALLPSRPPAPLHLPTKQQIHNPSTTSIAGLVQADLTSCTVVTFSNSLIIELQVFVVFLKLHVSQRVFALL